MGATKQLAAIAVVSNVDRACKDRLDVFSLEDSAPLSGIAPQFAQFCNGREIAVF